MLRQSWGSVVCPGCGNLVGVRDDRCLNCNRWNPGMWGFAPALTRLGRDMGFVPLVMWGCIAIYVASLLVGGINSGGGGLGSITGFLAPSTTGLFLFGASGAIPVFRYHRWWTVLSAGWLHGSAMHILFNMMSVRNVAPIIAEFYGASRMIIIYTVAGIAGFTLSSLMGNGFTVGASAAISGLLGALFHYGKRAGSSMVSEQAKSWAIGIIVMGFIIPGIDNWAHLGGFLGGYVCSRILDPLQPERLDHFIVALVCVGLTALAIVASVLHGLQFT